jgi:oxalate decarboxylase/phosphoglucose isomerase-like protein (cupin superfamily)
MSRYFIEPDEAETMVFDWGTAKWQAEQRLTGLESVSLGVVVMGPGDGHGRHNHPEADELLYVLSGTGEQMVEDADGTEHLRTVGAGSVVSIPKGLFHSTINTGWEPMRVVAVYAPAGPEAVLRALPDCRVVPAGSQPGT